jgi:hypothetical protein
MTSPRQIIITSAALAVVGVGVGLLSSTSVMSQFGYRAIPPSQWNKSTPEDVLIAYAGRQFVINGAKPWSFSSPDDDIVRFEVRKGDQYSGTTWTDVQGVERAEMGDAQRYPINQDISVEYSFMVEPGPKNTARWVTIGQLHSGMAMSPPVEIKLNGDDKMKISGNSGFGGDTTKAVYNDLYDDNEDIVRGHWYKMKLDIRFDPSGKGYAEIWRDGKKIVDYDGPLGYSNQKVTYWKQGVYRSTAPETLAVSYKDLKIRVQPRLD